MAGRGICLLCYAEVTLSGRGGAGEKSLLKPRDVIIFWLMNFRRISFCSVIVALFLSMLDAAPRRLSDLGGANNLTDKKFNVGDMSSPRSDEMFGAEKDRIKFENWHGSYSTIGDKRVDSLKTRGGKEFASDEVEYDMITRKQAQISLDTDERKLANVQNWNRVRDNVMSHKFSGTEMNTPEARRFSEMVDEVSLQDINRYQFWKNKTDAGIPVQTAGSGDGPQLSAEQRRVYARMKGEDVEVSDYESQGAQSVSKESSLKPKEEPGFFESLFDW